MKLAKKYLWDYKLPKNWKPKTDWQWLWYLERKINYDDWKGLKKEIIKKYFPKLKNRLDPGKRKMLELFFQKYERTH
jgi:hypothetical protein